MNSRNAVDSKAVYANYRASMRSLRGSDHKDNHRASIRKQTSLKVTADRYHLPISEVKEIVRTFDNESGVHHEYSTSSVNETAETVKPDTPEYSLEFEKAFNSFVEVQGEGPIGLQFLRSRNKETSVE